MWEVIAVVGIAVVAGCLVVMAGVAQLGWLLPLDLDEPDMHEPEGGGK